jgi:hypothetical protein
MKQQQQPELSHSSSFCRSAAMIVMSVQGLRVHVAVVQAKEMPQPLREKITDIYIVTNSEMIKLYLKTDRCFIIIC